MLELCPFCGGYARYQSLYANYEHIYCMKCGARTISIQATIEKPLKEVQEELKILWNRRSS